MSRDSRASSGLLSKVVGTALTPLHVAVSKPAQKAYLRTFLFTIASFVLISVSTFAYIAFYYSYVPQVGVERAIHLQFGNRPPYGSASLSSTLTSIQPYDITLYLHLPRSPVNLEAGNFMVEVSLISPFLTTSTTSNSSSAALADTVLARSRRPAILTYTSPLISTASTLVGLPWHVLGWKKESELLEISMFEGVEFPKGWKNIPNTVKVVVEADEKMHFYEVGIKIVARFGGLRYILYHHRILSYIFFTTTFYSVSLISTFLAYLLLTTFLSPTSTPFTSDPKSEPDGKASTIKPDPEEESSPYNPLSLSELSDTVRTFPTLGRQSPLRFPKREQHEQTRIKGEREEEEIERTTNLEPLTAEADDEGEDEDTDRDEDGEDDVDFPRNWRDSGLGTSFDEGERRRGVQRRRKALFSGGRGGE